MELKSNTKKMKNLSEDIFTMVPELAKGYQQYNIYMEPKLSTAASGRKQIYSGRTFGGTKKLYLNDIINSTCYDSSYMKNTKGLTEMRIESAPNQYFNISIDWNPNDPESATGDMLFDIMNYHPSIREKEPGYIDLVGSSVSQIFNFSNISSKILPRIPRLDREDTEFYFGFLYGINRSLAYYKKTGVFGVSKEKMVFQTVDVVVNKEIINNPNNNFSVIGLTIPSNILYSLQAEDINTRRTPNSLWAGYHDYSQGNQVGPKPDVCKLADIDDCPSDYYLIWADRAGAYQCQPFSKKNYRNETIKTTNSINYLGYNSVVQKQVENKWTLNSDWLSFEEHNCYESILVSPIVQLYDTKLGRLYDVNVVTSQWQEKNIKNTKKPFNLKLEVKTSRDENIIY